MNIIKRGIIKYKNRQLHKFGGSSLANVKCYQRVANIIKKYSEPGDLIVVSAAGTTTNQLINWLQLSAINHALAAKVQESICCYQENLMIKLLSKRRANLLKLQFLTDVARLSHLLQKPIDNNVYSEIVGHGEIWSARLMAAVLEEFGISSYWLDARLFLRAEHSSQPEIDEIASKPLLKKHLQKCFNKRVVMTGFIAKSKKGQTVLLGRNGSDYSATQVGALMRVKQVTIWSDVAGIYSADPHKVKDAYLLPLLRFDEASELARLAAPVLHARTLQPISFTNVDLQFRCSYEPEKGSTKIERVLESSTNAKIVTSHDDVCLIEIILSKHQNFFKIYKIINFFLKKHRLCPLAESVQLNHKLIQLCYTKETAYNVMYILKTIGVVTRITLRDRFSLVAIVGAGICNNSLYKDCFYQHLKDQPVEFFWHSKEHISLVAVLSTDKTLYLVRELHQSLFLLKKHFKLILFDKNNINFCCLILLNSEKISFCFILSKMIFL
ncbi:MAG: bifunctional aspartate kinase/homoserine dehydrogenase II [Arsenophonus sp.]|nr:MAG: bifunctional aspartate kinase/homoserine dehydrogenase II [Arsenophonus sp.]